MFGAVYFLCFVIGFVAMFKDGADFESAFKLIQFMITSILPLVTLAVGYYLGDRGKSEST